MGCESFKSRGLIINDAANMCNQNGVVIQSQQIKYTGVVLKIFDRGRNYGWLVTV